MASYPTLVFIELLNDQTPRINWLREKREDDIISNHYSNTNGDLVMIDCSDETIDEIEGREYLRQLGLLELIAVLFP